MVRLPNERRRTSRFASRVAAEVAAISTVTEGINGSAPDAVPADIREMPSHGSVLIARGMAVRARGMMDPARVVPGAIAEASQAVRAAIAPAVADASVADK